MTLVGETTSRDASPTPATLAGIVHGIAAEMATCWTSSTASEALQASLHRLLPGLRFCSIAVMNPVIGSLVSSANFATPGPTTLRLLEPSHSLAGICLSAGRPVGAGLQDRTACGSGHQDMLVWQLPDVQAILSEADAEGGAAGAGVSYLLCIPSGGKAEAVTVQEQHRHQTGQGVVTLGFPCRPEISARRAALLGMIADSLSSIIQRAAVDTLAAVNYMCGAEALTCTCCASDEEEEEESAGGPCRGDERGGGDGSHPPNRGTNCPGRRLQRPRLGS